MDGYDGYVEAIGNPVQGTYVRYLPPYNVTFDKPNLTSIFIMRGIDTNCLPIITYRTWRVYDKPDFTGERYGGSFCGESLLLQDVVVIIEGESL